jgi:hypothetical protein
MQMHKLIGAALIAALAAGCADTPDSTDAKAEVKGSKEVYEAAKTAAKDAQKKAAAAGGEWTYPGAKNFDAVLKDADAKAANGDYEAATKDANRVKQLSELGVKQMEAQKGVHAKH